MLKALTIRQPWGSAIGCGGKDIENRSWQAGHRGPLAIHAGKGIEWTAPAEAWTAAGLTPYQAGAPRKNWSGSLALGAIVAVADLTACHDFPECQRGREFCSPWAQRYQWHFVLRDIRPLASPVPCTGALGFWTVPDEAEAAVREQLEASHA